MTGRIQFPMKPGELFVEELASRCFEKPTEVIRLAEKAIGLIEPRLLPNLLGPYGSALRRTHRLKEARGALQAGIRMACFLRDLRLEACLVQKLAYVPADEGNHQTALKLSVDAANLFELTSDKTGVGQCLVDQGIWRFYLGDYKKALYSNKRALEILPFSEKRNRFAAITNQVFVYQKLGEISAAVAHLESAVRLSAGLSNSMLASLYLIWGRLDEDQGMMNSAASRYMKACEAFATSELYLDAALAGAYEVRILLGEEPTIAIEKAKLLSKLIEGLHSQPAVAVLTELIRQATSGQIQSIEKICRALEKVRARKSRPHLPPSETA